MTMTKKFLKKIIMTMGMVSMLALTGCGADGNVSSNDNDDAAETTEASEDAETDGSESEAPAGVCALAGICLAGWRNPGKPTARDEN